MSVLSSSVAGKPMATVYLSLGSNVDKTKNITAGIRALRETFGELVCSPVYENAAVGFEGDSFYNLVVGLVTDEPVIEVARLCRAIEEAQGRDRSAPKFSSRTLDIDLLLYDELVIDDGTLEIPRGEITRYAFVLRPLADIAPDVVHPQTGKTIAELWQAFGGDSEMQVVDLDLA